MVSILSIIILQHREIKAIRSWLIQMTLLASMRPLIAILEKRRHVASIQALSQGWIAAGSGRVGVLSVSFHRRFLLPPKTIPLTRLESAQDLSSYSRLRLLAAGVQAESDVFGRLFELRERASLFAEGSAALAPVARASQVLHVGVGFFRQLWTFLYVCRHWERLP